MVSRRTRKISAGVLILALVLNVFLFAFRVTSAGVFWIVIGVVGLLAYLFFRDDDSTH